MSTIKKRKAGKHLSLPANFHLVRLFHNVNLMTLRRCGPFFVCVTGNCQIIHSKSCKKTHVAEYFYDEISDVIDVEKRAFLPLIHKMTKNTYINIQNRYSKLHVL